MESTFMIGLVLGIFAIGFLLMMPLDSLLAANRETPLRPGEATEPACVMLTVDMTDEELTREIRAFHSKHKNMCIMLYDNPADRSLRRTK